MKILAIFCRDRQLSKESILDFIEWLGENEIYIDSQLGYAEIEKAFLISCARYDEV